ncbi:MAG: signal peptide peptidase SppA [Planctomycetes bacterium]|nr:signal peptide peptidase SppA [Planctomycetota bacterium]MCB9934817.1 signal peptide peptidase SppA [Planctomycetota bacterium]
MTNPPPAPTPNPGYQPPPPPPPPGPYTGVPSQPYRLSRPRTNIWRVLGVIIFVGVIGFNLLILLAMFGGAGVLGGGTHDPHGVVEYRRESGTGGKIAVISVEGVIMEGGGGLFGGGIDPVAMVGDGLNRAAADNEVHAVILEVNSPGGGVTASDQIHHQIATFRQETGKPVVVYMKDLAASGGYYISAPADYIVASRTTLTGSIGVVIQGFNFHGTLTDVVKGQDATIKAGGNKTMGSMFADPQSEEYRQGRELLQQLVDEMHGQFKQIVKDGRGDRLKPDWETYADGRILSATQAENIGLIDKIGYFEDAKAEAERLAGVSGLTVVEYGRDMSLGALLGLEAEDVQPKVEKAVSEQLSAELQEQLRLYPGRAMAIWTP